MFDNILDIIKLHREKYPEKHSYLKPVEKNNEENDNEWSGFNPDDMNDSEDNEEEEEATEVTTEEGVPKVKYDTVHEGKDVPEMAEIISRFSKNKSCAVHYVVACNTDEIYPLENLKRAIELSSNGVRHIVIQQVKKSTLFDNVGRVAALIRGLCDNDDIVMFEHVMSKHNMENNYRMFGYTFNGASNTTLRQTVLGSQDNVIMCNKTLPYDSGKQTASEFRKNINDETRKAWSTVAGTTTNDTESRMQIEVLGNPPLPDIRNVVEKIVYEEGTIGSNDPNYELADRIELHKENFVPLLTPSLGKFADNFKDACPTFERADIINEIEEGATVSFETDFDDYNKTVRFLAKFVEKRILSLNTSKKLLPKICNNLRFDANDDQKVKEFILMCIQMKEWFTTHKFRLLQARFYARSLAKNKIFIARILWLILEQLVCISSRTDSGDYDDDQQIFQRIKEDDKDRFRRFKEDMTILTKTVFGKRKIDNVLQRLDKEYDAENTKTWKANGFKLSKIKEKKQNRRKKKRARKETSS